MNSHYHILQRFPSTGSNQTYNNDQNQYAVGHQHAYVTEAVPQYG